MSSQVPTKGYKFVGLGHRGYGYHIRRVSGTSMEGYLSPV